jgi:small subunit ribosomal protein S19e
LALPQSRYLVITIAAICRAIYISKSTNVGIGTLKSHFGKKKRRGVKPPKFTKASGKIIREVVTQLKKNGYVENFATDNERTLGLTLTKQGRTELDKIATKIVKKN